MNRKRKRNDSVSIMGGKKDISSKDSQKPSLDDICSSALGSASTSSNTNVCESSTNPSKSSNAGNNISFTFTIDGLETTCYVKTTDVDSNTKQQRRDKSAHRIQAKQYINDKVPLSKKPNLDICSSALGSASASSNTNICESSTNASKSSNGGNNIFFKFDVKKIKEHIIFKKHIVGRKFKNTKFKIDSKYNIVEKEYDYIMACMNHLKKGMFNRKKYGQNNTSLTNVEHALYCMIKKLSNHIYLDQKQSINDKNQIYQLLMLLKKYNVENVEIFGDIIYFALYGFFVSNNQIKKTDIKIKNLSLKTNETFSNTFTRDVISLFYNYTNIFLSLLYSDSRVTFDDEFIQEKNDSCLGCFLKQNKQKIPELVEKICSPEVFYNEEKKDMGVDDQRNTILNPIQQICEAVKDIYKNLDKEYKTTGMKMYVLCIYDIIKKLTEIGCLNSIDNDHINKQINEFVEQKERIYKELEHDRNVQDVKVQISSKNMVNFVYFQYIFVFCELLKSKLQTGKYNRDEVLACNKLSYQNTLKGLAGIEQICGTIDYRRFHCTKRDDPGYFRSFFKLDDRDRSIPGTSSPAQSVSISTNNTALDSMQSEVKVITPKIQVRKDLFNSREHNSVDTNSFVPQLFHVNSILSNEPLTFSMQAEPKADSRDLRVQRPR